jgi:5'-3' exonuclease
LRSFLGVMHHTQCTRAVFCWDGKPKSTKVREEKPADYDEFKTRVQEAVEGLWSIPQIVSAEHEADDLVASVVYSDCVAEHAVIVSGDKDLQQLMNCRSDHTVDYYCLNTKSFLSVDSVVEKWSVKRPSHIAIALAVLGDRGDGIPGIKGWGPAKVAKLFETVTPEMDFMNAVLEIDRQIPEHLKETFYTCLEATMLHQDAVISRGPEVITWCHPVDLDAAGFGMIKDQYSSVYYSRQAPVEDLPAIDPGFLEG